MKTSNKLLLGMYLFTIITVLSIIILIIRRSSFITPNFTKETLVFDMKIDSLILNLNSTSEATIEIGDTFNVRYFKQSNIESKRIGKTLYLNLNNSVQIEIPDSIYYISVFAKKCKIDSFHQDSLNIYGLNTDIVEINNSEIKVLNIDSKASKFVLNNTNIDQFDVALKDYSSIRKANQSNVNQINGIVDSTSTVNFITDIKKVNYRE